METQFNRCVYAATRDEFDNHMAVFRTTSGAKVNNFLSDLPYANWACAHFIGNRYGEMTSHLVESLNSQISKYRGLSITEMICVIQSPLMLQMCLRNDIDAAWYTELCLAADERLDALVQEYRTWITMNVSDSIYEVLSDHVDVVDIQNRSCSCRMWQIEGFPCAHAVCILFPSDDTEGYEHEDEYFIVSSYILCYSQPIYPFCKPVVVDPPLPIIGPPDHQPRRGGPKSKRIPSRWESILSRMKCSRSGR